MLGVSNSMRFENYTPMMRRKNIKLLISLFMRSIYLLMTWIM
ncbi:hypothetical protein POPTR_011G142200v4 [Populus trichocarpa]|uniref:Uncharacterized protein n=1 Tax=Populus trichocarpa TaxID=3694 RepID=A0ACC0SA17_POPTR|nr:hypothetical protein POPTR_011G142200v4 [Populus trichocarpa]